MSVGSTDSSGASFCTFTEILFAGTPVAAEAEALMSSRYPGVSTSAVATRFPYHKVMDMED